MSIIVCKTCGKFFTVYNYRKNTAKCCSIKCANIYFKKSMRGKNSTPKIKKYCQVCSKVFYVLPCRVHILKHCSIKCLSKFRSKQHKGIKNINWKGGVTSINEKIRKSIEYRLWREAVFARDNWTCQKCNKQGVKLNAHHIKRFADYPELRFAIDNGITQCEKCHNKTKRKEYKHA